MDVAACSRPIQVRRQPLTVALKLGSVSCDHEVATLIPGAAG